MADAEVELPQVGQYRLTRMLHASSTGKLYAGRQPNKKECAVRIFEMPLATDEAKESFHARARMFKKLKDRNIVEVLDFGLTRLADKQDEYAYLVMQYVPGETLRSRLVPGEQISADLVKRFVTPVANALHYAHVHAVIHANLHPGNVLLGANNDTLLADFALLLPGTGTSADPHRAAIPYMAPEQLQGDPIAASDQYALAVIAYELLCGRRPYMASERDELLHQQEHEALTPPRSLNAHISAAVEAVLMQALAVDPNERFPQAQAFANAYLEALMGLSTYKAPVRRVAQFSSIPSNSSSSPSVIASKGKTKAAARLHITSQADDKFDDYVSVDDLAFGDDGFQDDINDSRAGVGGDDETFDDEDDNPRKQRMSAGEAVRLHDTVVADLGQGGILSQSLPGYEERPAQIEMATLVGRSLAQDRHAITEASTGTGKSLAYLVPIVRSGKVAIISTANKALQEQLFYKDIPFVQQHIKPFEAALVKGMGNYVCIDRLESERTGIQFYAKNREFTRLVDITNDEESTFNGDFETLDFLVPGDIRGKICADTDACAWKKCNYYEDCYVRKMRDKADRAQIIVVNHTLLLLDAALEGKLLPERDVIVLDEAHHLEEEATRSFTITISPNSIASLLAQKLLKDHSQVSLQDDVDEAAKKTWNQLQMVADPGYKGRANLQAPIEEGLKLASLLADLKNSLLKQKPVNLSEKDEQLYSKLVKRTQNLAENIRIVFSVDQPGKFVYYVERVVTPGQRGNVHLQVSAAPLDVTDWLRERLFDKCNVICTSATLATVGVSTSHADEKGPNFSYFRRRVGLDAAHYPEVIERVLPLTFDYESQALLYLPRDLPAPVYGNSLAADEYNKSIAREMYKLVRRSRGRAFLLFSSKRMLDQAYDLMMPHLDFPLLKQGDMSRIELTRRFREEQGSILFGLKSFWEGVDIAGEALSLVVIDKLPFDPPDDPVHEARVAQMKAMGENWFGTYVLPQAVLRLKQGLGRLLRTHEDRGVLAILDTRLHTKGYGRIVLDALPPARRTSNLSDVTRFFAEEES
jgi:Rad3-related DNA helicase/serine/threonine protein kinase